ncbi:MAG: protease modulator HflC [Verrucomicrobiales bacterium]
MKALFGSLGFATVLVLLLMFLGSVYTVKETEHVIITRFGAIVGESISTPGLRFKLPFIDTVNRLEKRLLNWDGRPITIPTKDKAYVTVDTYARWWITDPAQFFIRFRDLRSAESRLEDILGSETRNAIARNELIEIVRTDKTRTPTPDETLKEVAATETGTSKIGVLPPIRVGRAKIEEEIKQAAAPKLKDPGIELLDVRFKRINYEDDVLVRVYQRMTSERLQIAQRFRSEGGAEAARINGDRERDLNQIESAAYKQVQQLRGEADAQASRIYAEAYATNPAAPEFYQFLKSLETFRAVVGKDTTLLLSTDSDLFRLLKEASAEESAPGAPPGAPPFAPAEEPVNAP